MYFTSRVELVRSPSTPSDALMAMLAHEISDESVKDGESVSLYNFHQHPGYQAHDAVDG